MHKTCKAAGLGLCREMVGVALQLDHLSCPSGALPCGSLCLVPECATSSHGALLGVPPCGSPELAPGEVCSAEDASCNVSDLPLAQLVHAYSACAA